MAENAGNDDGGLQAIAESTSQFGNNFFKAIAIDNPGNLITSPLSAQVVLAMAAYGAGGKTAAQMRSVLLIPSDNELGQSGYQSVIESLNTVKEVELRLANKIYAASHLEIKSAYKILTGRKFLSESQELDFNNPSAVANSINAWCEEQTNKRIKDVVKPADVGPDTKLVLVNAVYFKGHWKKKFDPAATEDRPFHVDEKITESVPTMFINAKFRFGDIPKLDARFIEIPYKGDQLSMIVILPNEVNGLKTVQNNIHELNLRESLQEAWPASEIELFLPKFRIESTLNLKNSLEKLGMTDMFTDQADFSDIADIPLKISKVIQKAFIEVNEEGSEAAAVTTSQMSFKCAMSFNEPPPTFKVDRPFHYAIYHHKIGISLFTGIVEQPNLV